MLTFTKEIVKKVKNQNETNLVKENVLFGVVSVSPTTVTARRVVNGKFGRGRPSKFPKNEIENLLGRTLEVTE